MRRSKSHISNFTILSLCIMSLLLFFNCLKFHKRRMVIEPVNVVIVDDSRVDNTKVRHVFREFFLKEVIDEGMGWLILFDVETLSADHIESLCIEYVIIFDVADYGVYDIEAGIDKIVASAKIVECQNSVVHRSFIESTQGRDIERICECVAQILGRDVVKELASLRARTYEVPDVLSEPEDSSQIEQ